MKRSVFVIGTTPKSLRKDVERVINNTGLLTKFKMNKTVLIKINGNCDKYYPGSNTSPWFLDSLLKILKKNNYKDIKVIEGNLFEFTVEEMLEKTHIGEVIDQNKVDYINYESLPRDRFLTPKILKNSQLINVPVMHTHGFAKISVATKNFWGFYPVTRRHLHKELNKRMIELYRRIPCYTIVDGTVGMVGDSTRTGLPKSMNLILAGWDNLAVDRVAAKIMGFKDKEIPLIAYAEKKKILPEVRVIGDFNYNNLPSIDFNYQDTLERKVTRWMEGLDNPNPVNAITSFLLHAPGIDWVYNRIRMVYNNRQFQNKRKKIFKGTWLMYEKNTPYINYRKSH